MPEARQILSEFKRKIAAKYPLREMRLFGSTAKGTAASDSDLDVFIRLPQVNRGIEEDVFDMAYDIELEYDCLLDVFESLDFQHRISSNTRGNAIRNISSVGDLKRLGVPLPPLEEQHEIVRRLDALLTHEAEAAALLDMDEQFDLLEQSILARAFRSELGTRDPADAPAVIG